MVNPHMPDQWTISLGASAEKLAGIYERLARGAGRVRAAQPPAAPRRPGTPASTTTGSSRCPDTELERDESIRADTSLEKLAQAQAGVRQGRHGHRGQLVAAQRRRRRAAASATRRAREARREPLGADRRRAARTRVDPDVFGIAPGRGGQQRARARRDRLGRRRGRRAQRGVRGAVAGVHRRVAELDPETREPQRRRDRDRAPARRSRRAHPRRRSPTSCKRRGGGYGVAAICIGVGQGLAVVLEAA